MTTNAFNWIEIYVQDLDRAAAFYEAVLKIHLQAIESDGLEMKAFPMKRDAPGCSGALVKMDGVASGGNSTISYFHSEDCAVEAARIVPSGGRIHKDKFSIGPYGFIVLALDSEGNMFGIHSMK